MKINIKNIDTNYINVGSGETIFLLHGWGSNIKLFDKMINSLCTKYNVIALDMAGFGETYEPDFAMNVDDYTDFVTEFIKKMDIKKLHILGHSFGGRIIIKMLSRKNDFEIKKVILVDSAGIKPKLSAKVKLKVKIFKISRKLFENTVLGKMYPNFIDNMRKKSGSADYNLASPMMKQILVKVVNEDLTPLLQNIKNETLLIWGDLDDATPIQDAYTMNKLIKNSTLQVVNGAGHYSFLEKADFVNNKIQEFLDN